MTDVAELAGVSQTTVSLILSGAANARLAASTRKRVLQVAKSIGYQRGARTAGLPPASGSGLIGLIVNEISPDPWCALAMDGARLRAAEYGWTIITAVTGNDAAAEAQIFEQFATMRLQGVIYGRIHTTRAEPPEALRRFRAVLLNCYVADHSLASIVPGEVGAGHAATDRLIRAGHRRIGFISGEHWMDASRDRLKGYRQSLATADLPFDPALVRHGNWQPTSGYECTHDLMRTEAPTAIFCANDLMALGCMMALAERGLRVPQDISVIGFDDREIAQHTRPPLTTVTLPHVDMGAMAMDLLLEQIQNSASPPRSIKVECSLVERQTVADFGKASAAARAGPHADRSPRLPRAEGQKAEVARTASIRTGGTAQIEG